MSHETESAAIQSHALQCFSISRTLCQKFSFTLGYLDPHLLHGSFSQHDSTQHPKPHLNYFNHFLGLMDVSNRPTWKQTNHATRCVMTENF